LPVRPPAARRTERRAAVALLKPGAPTEVGHGAAAFEAALGAITKVVGGACRAVVQVGLVASRFRGLGGGELGAEDHVGQNPGEGNVRRARKAAVGAAGAAPTARGGEAPGEFGKPGRPRPGRPLLGFAHRRPPRLDRIVVRLALETLPRGAKGGVGGSSVGEVASTNGGNNGGGRGARGGGQHGALYGGTDDGVEGDRRGCRGSIGSRSRHCRRRSVGGATGDSRDGRGDQERKSEPRKTQPPPPTPGRG